LTILSAGERRRMMMRRLLQRAADREQPHVNRVAAIRIVLSTTAHGRVVRRAARKQNDSSGD
jgi:hypothetical protein